MPFSEVTITTVDTTALTSRLGTETEVFDSTLGRFRTWIYLGSAETVTAFAAGELAMHDSVTPATSRGTVLITTGAVHPERIVGVAQHAVAALGGAWFGRKGEFEVMFSAADPAVGLAITPSATVGAAVSVAAAAEPGFGYSIDDPPGSTAVTCWINCRG